MPEQQEREIYLSEGISQMVKMDNQNRAKQFAPFDALKGHNEAIKEKEAPVFNIENQVAVPVIANFNSEGGMIPIYFAMNGIKIKIDNIQWKSDKKTWGSQYRCEFVLNNRVETVDLFYYNTHRIWTMPKK